MVIQPPMVSGEPPGPPGIPSLPNSAHASHHHHQYAPPPPPIFIQQPMFVRPMIFGHRSQSLVCPNCSASIMSQTKYETGLANWLVAGGVCLIG